MGRGSRVWATWVLASAVVVGAEGLRAQQQQQRTEAAPGPVKVDPVYRDLAAATGGQVFAVSPSELGSPQATSLMTASALHPATLLASRDSLGSEAGSYSFPVDSTVTGLSVVVSGARRLQLYRPDGRSVEAGEQGVEAVRLTQVQGFVIDAPQAGGWTAKVQGPGEVIVTVRAKTSLDLLSFEFVELRGRPGHQGYFGIDGYPLAGEEGQVRAELSETVQTVRYELRTADGAAQIVMGKSTGQDDELLGSVVVPVEPFRAYAVGMDRNGRAFQRTGGQIYAPPRFRVVPEARHAEVWAGDKRTIRFRVENRGPAAAFRITAFGTPAEVVSTKPDRLELARGETSALEVEVSMPYGARPGSSSSLIVGAELVDGAEGPASNSAVVEMTVRQR